MCWFCLLGGLGLGGRVWGVYKREGEGDGLVGGGLEGRGERGWGD